MKRLFLTLCVAITALACSIPSSAARFKDCWGVQPTSFAGMGNNNEDLAYVYYTATTDKPTITYKLFGSVDYIKRIRIYAIPYDATAGDNSSGLSVSDAKMYDYRDPIHKMNAVLIAETEDITANGVAKSLTAVAPITQNQKYMLYLTADLKTVAEKGGEVPLMNGGSNYTKIGGVITYVGAKSVTNSILRGTGLAESSVNTAGTRVVALKKKLLYAPGDWYSKYYRIPALAQAADGSLVAISDARKYHIHDISNDIDMLSRRSFDNGSTWSDPVTVAKGSGGSESMTAEECRRTQGYGDAALAALPNGDLICTLIGGGRLAETSTDIPTKNFYALSHDNGRTWSALKEIPSDVYSNNRGCIAPGNMTVVKEGLLAGKVLACFRSYSNISGTRNYTTVGNFILCYNPDTDTWTRLGNGNNPNHLDAIINSNGSTTDDEAHLLEVGENKFLMSIRTSNSVQNYRTYRYVTLKSATQYKHTATSSNNPGLSTFCNSDIMKYTDKANNSYMLQCLPCGTASDGNGNTGVRSELNFLYTNGLYNGSGTMQWKKSLVVSDPLKGCGETAQYSSMTVQNDGNIGLLFEDYPYVVRHNDDVVGSSSRGDFYLASWYIDFRIGDLIEGAETPEVKKLIPPTITPDNGTYIQTIASNRPEIEISQANTITDADVHTYYQFEYYTSLDAAPKLTAMTSFTGESKAFTWTEVCNALGITDVAVGSYLKVLAKCSATGYETTTITSVIYNFKQETRKIRVVSMPTSGLGNIELSSPNIGVVEENEVLTVGVGDLVNINAPAKTAFAFEKFSYTSDGAQDLSKQILYTEMNDMGYQIQFEMPSATAGTSAVPNNNGDELVIYVFYESRGGLYTKLTMPVDMPENKGKEFSKWWSSTSTLDENADGKGEPAPDEVPEPGTHFGVPNSTDNVAVPKYDNGFDPEQGFLYYYQDQVDAKHLSLTKLEILPGKNASQNFNCVVMAKIGDQWLRRADGTISYSLFNGRNFSYPESSVLYQNARYRGVWYADFTTPKVVSIDNFEILTPENFDSYLGGEYGYPDIEVTIFVELNNITSLEQLASGKGYLFKVVHPLRFLEGVLTGVDNVKENSFTICRADGGALFKTTTPLDVTIIDVYGRIVRKLKLTDSQMISLDKGVYIANGKKFVVM